MKYSQGKKGMGFYYDQNIKHQVVSQEFKLLWNEERTILLLTELRSDVILLPQESNLRTGRFLLADIEALK